MRTVFFGTPQLAVPSLAAVARRHEVAAVVCQPDRPQGRSGKPVPPPTKVWAEEHGIPVVQPSKLNDGEFEAWLRAQNPGLCVLAAYGRMLKQAILDVPPHGFLNMHPSLLPLYRGPSPIQSAILNGDTETGVTIMRITLEMDSGDILSQERVSILPEDNSESLTDRLAELGGEMLAEGVSLVEGGQAIFTPQDHARATYCRLFEKRDGRIDWAKPAAALHNLVRAANPWPGAQCLFRGEVCRIHQSLPVRCDTAAAPGTVVQVEKDRAVVATGEGGLAVLVFQAPGKRALPMQDYLRGHAIDVGERFESIP
ncbi:MAG: methionyl-tRNA formyltransferase [Candidatus Hydrogenedentes bacterium]|nr:methionyl-tRNA formyltransferase [Candidatus Hydrogenedentota bacterium]